MRQAVSIGVPPGTPGPWLLSIVDAVDRSVPHAALSYLEATSSDQLRLLHEGMLDVCLLHQPPPSRHVSWLLREEPLGLAVRRGPPAGRQSRLPRR